jgi:hypothetical protein
MTDADLLAARVTAELPPPSTWTMPPRGYRQGLALCVIDGVARAASGDDEAVALIDKFRTRLGEAAEGAGVTALRAEDSGNDSHAGSLIGRAAQLLADAKVESTSDLVERIKAEGLDGDLGSTWTSTDGLTSRMWADTAMLAGYMDPNVDRIISTYVSQAIGSDPVTTPPDRVIAALTEVAERFDSKILPLEFAILRYERP